MKKLINDLRCLISIIILLLSNSLHSEFQNTESIYQINYIIDPLDSVIGWNVGGINSGYEISIDKSETITLSDNPALELKYDFLSLDNAQTLCAYQKIIRFPYESKRLNFWVNGDNSGHILRIWLSDNNQEFHKFEACKLDFNEWKKISVDVNTTHSSSGGDFDGIMQPPIHFFLFAIEPSIYSHNLKGSIYIDELSIDALIPLSKSVDVSIKSPKVGNIFTTDEPIKFNLKLNNFADTKRKLLLKYYVLNAESCILHSDSKKVSIKSKTQKTIPLNIPLEKNGCFTLHLTCDSNDNIVHINKKIPFSQVLPLIPDRGTGVFGVCTSFGQSRGDIETDLSLAALAGFQWIRDEMKWEDVEKIKGHIHIPTNYEKYVDIASKNGLQTLLILNYGNPFYEDKKPPVTEEGLNAFTKYCTTLVQHFKNKINHFEIWNEYNINPGQGRTPEDYARMIKIVYSAIKKENPNAIVIGGATAGLDIYWLERVFKADGHNYMDAVSIIPHFYPRSPEEENIFVNLKNLSNIINSYGSEKSIWLSETGWPTHKWRTGISEKLSGAYLVRLYVTAIALKFPQIIFWHELQNDGTIPESNEQNFGLIRCWQDEDVPFSAKENFVAMNVLTHKLHNKELVTQLFIQENLYSFYFHQKDNPQNGLMILLSSKEPKHLGVHLGMDKIKLTDLMGNTTEIKPVDGLFSFLINEYPIYLEGTFKTFEMADSSFKILNPKIQIVAGDPFIIEIQKPKSNKYSVQTQLPIDWKLKNEKDTLSNFDDKINLRIQTSLNSELKNYEIPIYIMHKKTIVAKLNASINVLSPFHINIKPEVLYKNQKREWGLSINIKNNSQFNSYSGQIIPQEPLPWATHSNPLNFKNLKPLEAPEFIIQAPEIGDGQDIGIILKTKLDEGFEEITKQRVIMLAVTKTHSKITIDGDLSDWTNAIPFYLNHPSQVQMIKDWSGPDDFSGIGYLQWDEENIYLAVNITDNIFSQNESDESIWKGDSLQVAFDFELSRDPNRKGYHEIGYGLCNNKVVGWRWYSVYGKSTGAFTEGQASIIRKDNKTIYEIAIPRISLLPENRKIQPKEVIGFALLINENDGDQRRGWMEYMQGIGWTKDPNLLGEILIAP